MGSEGWVRISTGGGVDWWHGSVGAWALCGRGLVPDRGIRRKVVEELELVHDDVEASGVGWRLGAVPAFLEVAVDEDSAPVLEVLADGLGVLVEGGDGDMGPLFEEAPGPAGMGTAADDEDGEGGDDRAQGSGMDLWVGGERAEKGDTAVADHGSVLCAGIPVPPPALARGMPAPPRQPTRFLEILEQVSRG